MQTVLLFMIMIDPNRPQRRAQYSRACKTFSVILELNSHPTVSQLFFTVSQIMLIIKLLTMPGAIESEKIIKIWIYTHTCMDTHTQTGSCVKFFFTLSWGQARTVWLSRFHDYCLTLAYSPSLPGIPLCLVQSTTIASYMCRVFELSQKNLWKCYI